MDIGENLGNYQDLGGVVTVTCLYTWWQNEW